MKFFKCVCMCVMAESQHFIIMFMTWISGAVYYLWKAPEAIN